MKHSLRVRLSCERVLIYSVIMSLTAVVSIFPAVSSTASDITYFCCVNADINDVFGGATPALTQMILICLMQQLATMIVSPNPNWSTQLELEWLQEIALCLNPADPLIVKHVPPVLQLLVSGINTRMAQNDPALRRPLQRLLQVIRGMQMT